MGPSRWEVEADVEEIGASILPVRGRYLPKVLNDSNDVMHLRT